MGGTASATAARDWRRTSPDRSRRARPRRQQRAQRVDRVGFARVLVRAVALDPREAERHTAGIAGRDLDAVERDLHHQLGTYHHRDAAALGLAVEELSGLPSEELVGQALEALADHHELPRAWVGRAEVEVREPAAAASVAPLGAEHNEVVGADRLDLAPGPAAPACGVRRGGVFDDDALVTCLERSLEYALCFRWVRGEHA